MTGIIEEFAVYLAASLVLRAVGAIGQLLSVPEKATVPRRQKTCAHCGDQQAAGEDASK